MTEDISADSELLCSRLNWTLGWCGGDRAMQPCGHSIHPPQPQLQLQCVDVMFFPISVGLLFLVWTIEEVLNIQVFCDKKSPTSPLIFFNSVS